MKIGVFDSGIGGITVLSEIRKRLGSLDFIYLGDTAHLPYGAKSPAQVERLSVDCARILKDKRVDALVVACNTASSLAIEAIRRVMDPIPVFGMVEPGVEAVFGALREMGQASVFGAAQPSILVLATRATVKSGAYGRALKKESYVAIEQACPLLVPMIEEGWIDHALLHDTLAVYLKPYLSEVPGVVLLGCTHYPWITQAIQKALPGWKVVNSAHAVASALERCRFLVAGTGQVEWIFTDPDAVPAFAIEMIQSINLGGI